MASKEKGSTAATYCAAGNPNMINCANRTGMPGISMHYFSRDETLRQKWIRFVRIHRKDFVPVKQSTLCSAHFDESCFNVVGIPLYDKSGTLIKAPKRSLIDGSIPSRDSLVPRTSPPTSRKRRKVSNIKAIKALFPLIVSYTCTCANLVSSFGMFILFQPQLVVNTMFQQ